MDMFLDFDLKELLQIPSILIAIGTIVAGLIAAAISIVNMIISKENKISELRQEWINSFRDEISKMVSSIDIILISFNEVEKSKEDIFLDAWVRCDENKEHDGMEPPSRDPKQLYKKNEREKIFDPNKKLTENLSSALTSWRLRKRKIKFDTTPIPIQEAQILLKKNKKPYSSFLESYKKVKLWLQEDSDYYYNFSEVLNDIYNDIHFPEKGIDEILVKQDRLLYLSQKIIKNEWKIIKDGEKTFRNTKRLSILVVIIAIFGIIITIVGNSRVDRIGDVLIKINSLYRTDEKIFINISYVNKGNTSISLYLKEKFFVVDGNGKKFDYIGINNRDRDIESIGEYHLADLSINQNKKIVFLFNYPYEYINNMKDDMKDEWEKAKKKKANDLEKDMEKNANIHITACYAIHYLKENNNQKEFRDYCSTITYYGGIP